MKKLNLELALITMTLIVMICLLFLFRFELVSSSTDGRFAYKLDRWSGRVSHYEWADEDKGK
jgi:hypothetical protein